MLPPGPTHAVSVPETVTRILVCARLQPHESLAGGKASPPASQGETCFAGHIPWHAGLTQPGSPASTHRCLAGPICPACPGEGDRLSKATGSTGVFRLCSRSRSLGVHPALAHPRPSLPKRACIYAGLTGTFLPEVPGASADSHEDSTECGTRKRSSLPGPPRPCPTTCRLHFCSVPSRALPPFVLSNSAPSASTLWDTEALPNPGLPSPRRTAKASAVLEAGCLSPALLPLSNVSAIKPSTLSPAAGRRLRRNVRGEGRLLRPWDYSCVPALRGQRDEGDTGGERERCVPPSPW